MLNDRNRAFVPAAISADRGDQQDKVILLLFDVLYTNSVRIKGSGDIVVVVVVPYVA